MKKPGTNPMARLCSILAVLAVLLGAAVLLLRTGSGRDVQPVYELSPEITPLPPTASPTPAPSPSPTPEPTPEPTPTPVYIPIDFDGMQSINSDVVGWITVDGTDIDYPVLWDATENYYYLSHTYRGEYKYSGSIFMIGDNSRDFSDRNTVLYGHNMGDGTMFAQLHRFENRDFFDEQRYITVYTNHSMLTYEIFAAYKTDDNLITQYYDFSTEEGYGVYLDSVFSHSGFFRDDISVTTADRIITLSTCIGDANYRYLVQGILLSEQPGE